MSLEKVIDVSASAGWFLPDEKSSKADQLLERVFDGELLLVEPALWQYEMVNLLKSAVKRKRLTSQSAHQALHLLAQIPMTFPEQGPEGWVATLDAAIDHDLSAYDAAYFHFAQSRGIELVTADEQLLALRPQFNWIKSLDEQ